jgi:hypothetical protein
MEETTMTEKAQKILQRLKRRRTLSRSPEARDHVLGEFNASTLDSVGPIEGDQGMKVLQEMNELGKAQEQIIREGIPNNTVH